MEPETSNITYLDPLGLLLQRVGLLRSIPGQGCGISPCTSQKAPRGSMHSYMIYFGLEVLAIWLLWGLSIYVWVLGPSGAHILHMFEDPSSKSCSCYILLCFLGARVLKDGVSEIQRPQCRLQIVGPLLHGLIWNPWATSPTA